MASRTTSTLFAERLFTWDTQAQTGWVERNQSERTPGVATRASACLPCAENMQKCGCV